MIVNMTENAELKETVVTIECRKADSDILRLISAIKNFDNSQKIVCTANGETYFIDCGEILYFESVDRNTFCYTESKVYETPLKLYEIEEMYEGCDFIRSTKSTVININRIKSVRPEFGGKITATMENGEKMFISRQYVPVFKQKLGIGGKQK